MKSTEFNMKHRDITSYVKLKFFALLRLSLAKLNLRVSFVAILTSFVLASLTSFSATRYSVATGNWNSTATWSAVSGGQSGASVPVAGDVVYITNGRIVTIDIATAACATLTIGPSTSNNSISVLAFNNGSILSVSGNITFGSNGQRKGSLNMTNGGILKIGGALTVNNLGAWTPGSGTIEYEGPAQTIYANTYNNLTLSGSGSKTITTATTTVNGILSMEGTATASAVPTYGTAATLQYNTTTARNAGVEWITPFGGSGGIGIKNTGAITLTSNKVVNFGLNINSGAGGLIVAPGIQLTVTGTLTNNAGTVALVLQSSASGTASLLNNTSSVNATVNRYVAADWKWHNLSSPVSAQPAWPGFVPDPTSGSSYSTYSWGSPPFNSDYYYFNPNYSTGYWVNLRLSNGAYNYGAVDAANASAGFGTTAPPAMTVGRGYLVAYSTAYGTTTHTFSGALNTGDVALSRPNSYSQYNFIGNPYPSSLDWQSASWSRGTLELSGTGYDYWIWNDGSGNYEYFNSGSGIGSTNASRYIAPTQGFFVKASSTGTFSLTIPNSARAHSSQAWLKSTQAVPGNLQLQLSTSANTYSDVMYVDFNDAYSGAEGTAKFWSWRTEAPEIYSVKGGNYYSIDRYPEVTEELTIDLLAKTGVTGTYTISAPNIDGFSLAGTVILKNVATGEEFDLTNDNTYEFTAAGSATPKAFQLIFRAPNVNRTVQAGSWNSASTWSGGNIPTAADKTQVKHAVAIDNTTAAECSDLSVNATGALTINDGNSLTVNGALSNVNGASGLVVKSGGSLITKGTVSGEATIERAITGGEWHFISSPVPNAVSSLFTGKYLQSHDEATNVYTDIISTTELLNPGQGYALFSSTPFTAQFTCAPATGDKTIAVTHNGNGWNLVGNPYPSAIDWEQVSKTGVNNATYIHVNASTWASYAGGVGSNGGSQFIAPCQGFFVEATAPGSLQLQNNTVRTNTSAAFFKNSRAVNNLVRLQVSGNGYSDETVVRFLPEATEEFDGEYDAHKLFGDMAEAAQLYSASNLQLSINTLPETSMVPLGMHAGAAGEYTLAATEVNDLKFITLEDTKTGIFTELTAKPYTFSFTPGENEQRFKLHFSALGITDPADSKQVTVYSYGKDIFINTNQQNIGACDVFIFDASGRQVQTAHFTPAAGSQKFTSLSTSGLYIVKVITHTGTTSAKVVIP